MRFLSLLSVVALMALGAAQDFQPDADDPGIIAIVEEKPLSPPSDMQQAAQAIANACNGLAEEMAVIAGHEAFLGNDSLNLTNASLFYA